MPGTGTDDNDDDIITLVQNVLCEDGVDAAADRGGNKDGTEFWGYVDVRRGAHMFYWLYHSYHADGYRHRPLIIWLQVY